MTNRLVAADANTVTVVNTTTETELVSLIVPAYGLATGQVVRLTVAGDFLNNSGGAATLLFKVKLGTSVALTTQALSIPASANGRKWRMIVDVLAETDALQRLSAQAFMSEALTQDFAWSEWSADGATAVGYGTDTEDGTSTVDVSVTATLGTAATTINIRRHMGFLEAVHGSVTLPDVSLQAATLSGTATVTSSLWVSRAILLTTGVSGTATVTTTLSVA